MPFKPFEKKDKDKADMPHEGDAADSKVQKEVGWDKKEAGDAHEGEDADSKVQKSVGWDRRK